MKSLFLATATGAFALAGCATASPPTSSPGDEAPATLCDGPAGQAFIGQKASPATGSQLIAATGAKTLRWVPPRSAVTMDYRPDRLTVSYDDDMVITQVSCT